MLIPSTIDDSLAPPGAHVASLFCQHFRYQLPEGRRWQEERDAAADRIIDTVPAYAPNFRRSIMGTLALSPLDLEERFGLLGGDIFHGALGLDQLWAARPLLGFGDYRTPLRRSLYVWIRHPSRRWCDRRPGPQCGARDHQRPSLKEHIIA